MHRSPLDQRLSFCLVDTLPGFLAQDCSFQGATVRMRGVILIKRGRIRRLTFCQHAAAAAVLLLKVWSSFCMSGHQLTWVTDTGVAVPVVTAVAVLGTRVGITRVIHFTALPHVNLDSLFHVECRYVCRCLSHSYSLVMKDNYFKIRISFQSTVLCVSLFSSINEATF